MWFHNPYYVDIEQIMATSRDYKELAYVFKAWRDATGKKMKDLYPQFVELGNKAAVANREMFLHILLLTLFSLSLFCIYSEFVELNNLGDLWLLGYEAEDFRDQMTTLWNDVSELYYKLYAYVRFKLADVYPDQIKGDSEPLPAHIFG